jgi:hypothetical protein
VGKRSVGRGARGRSDEALTALERAELTLMDAAQAARKRGLTIISGRFAAPADSGRLVGCCPIGAADGGYGKLALVASDSQRMAFIRGFDDRGPMLVNERQRSWYALGCRLRRRLNPIPWGMA